MTIQLQGKQKFSQEVAVSEVVPEDVLFGRDVPIGIPLLDTFPRQVRKAMWDKMNKEFAGAMVVTRAQAIRNQELLLLRPKEEGDITEEFESSCNSEEASEEGEELESLSTEMLEKIQSAKKYEVEKGSPMAGGRRTDETKIGENCDQMHQNYICENNEFNFDDALFQEPGWG